MLLLATGTTSFVTLLELQKASDCPPLHMEQLLHWLLYDLSDRQQVKPEPLLQ
jgi:hypothetical protein